MIAFDTERFFSWEGKDLTFTLEFWMTGDVSGSKDEHCLVGFTGQEFFDQNGDPVFDAYDIDVEDTDWDVDGLFVSGNILYVRHQGQHICSAPVTTMQYPTLIDIIYTSDSVAIMINGEIVANGSIDEFSLTNPFESDPNKPNTWFFKDRKYGVISNRHSGDYYFEINNLAMYPYAVAGVAAKRRFIRGQAVEDIDLLNNRFGAESINCSHASSANSPVAVYSSDFRWDNTVLSNLEVRDNKLVLSKPGKPDFIGTGIDYETYEGDIFFDPYSGVRFNRLSSYVESPAALLYLGNGDVLITNKDYPRYSIYSNYVGLPVGGSGDWYLRDSVTGDEKNLGNMNEPLMFFDEELLELFDDPEYYNFCKDLPNAELLSMGREVTGGSFIGEIAIFSQDDLDNFYTITKGDINTGEYFWEHIYASYVWRMKYMPSDYWIPQKDVDVGTSGYLYDNINLDYFADPETRELNSLQFNFTYPTCAKKSVNVAGLMEPIPYIRWGPEQRYINAYVAFTPEDNFFAPQFKRRENKIVLETMVWDNVQLSTSPEHVYFYPVFDSSTVLLDERLEGATMHLYVDFTSPGYETFPLKLDYIKITPNNKSTTVDRAGHEVTLPSSGNYRISHQSNEYFYRGRETGWLNLDEQETIAVDVEQDTKLLSFFFRKNYVGWHHEPVSFIRLNTTTGDKQLNFGYLDDSRWKTNYSFSDDFFDAGDVYLNGRLLTRGLQKLSLNYWYHVQVEGDFGDVTGIELGPHMVFDNIALFDNNNLAGRDLFNLYVGKNSKQSISNDGFVVNEGTSRVFNNVKRESYEIKL